MGGKQMGVNKTEMWREKKNSPTGELSFRLVLRHEKFSPMGEAWKMKKKKIPPWGNCRFASFYLINFFPPWGKYVLAILIVVPPRGDVV